VKWKWYSSDISGKVNDETHYRASTQKSN